MIGGRRKKSSDRKTAISLMVTDKTKYLLEIAARKRYSSLSSVVEESLRLFLIEIFGVEEKILIEQLYDTDEFVRIKKLKENMPHLITFNEELILKQEKLDKNG